MDQQAFRWTQTDITGKDLLHAMRTGIFPALKETPLVTATVLTLGLYSRLSSAKDRHDWVQFAAEISHVHPCRILVIEPTAQREGPNHLDADISAVINYSRHREWPVLYSECVHLSLKGALRHQWIDLVLPLVSSDLPAYFYWIGDPPDDTFRWDLLATGFRHLLIDSGADSLHRWGPALHAARQQHLSIDDLDWQRLAPWRAQWAFIADLELGSALFFHPKTITIRAPLKDSGRWQLLLGWLADRLNW
ncbi:MAG: glucose-6-phosphate dehydrogenase assembly protein OpcA, partial [Firmicutes bacterium]|nr:glucose-6-phosphate dehydrogenase assembly protein OpcA [Bacillota bacterium]